MEIYPYNQMTKYSAVAYRINNETIRIYFKGNPSVLLENCGY